MIKARALSTIAFTLLVATGDATAEKGKPAGGDYFPLRAGDSWTYRNTTDDGEYSLKVLRAEKQPDGSARYLVEMLSGVKVHSLYSKTSGWVLLHEERYPEHEGLEVKYEPARQYLPNPLVAGSKWKWKGKDYTQTERSESSEVIDFEEITVRAGKFRALKVVSQVDGAATPMTRTSWYADGVGLVKSTTEGGEIRYGWELADYSFKQSSKN